MPPIYKFQASIWAVMETLCEGYPPLCDVLLEGRQISLHFKITLNGHNIQLADGLDTVVTKEDQIAIFSPTASG